MSDFEVRKVQVIDNTLYSNIPAEYAKKLGIEVGDQVFISCDEKKGTLTLKKVEQ